MNTYRRHRFPPDIISYAVWLYYRFNLSHRDIECLLAERGKAVSHFHDKTTARTPLGVLCGLEAFTVQICLVLLLCLNNEKT